MKITKNMLTDWIDYNTKPAHVGVYEVDLADNDGRAFSFWDGNAWFGVRWENIGFGGAMGAIRRAAATSYPNAYTSFRYRGLNFDPAKVQS